MEMKDTLDVCEAEVIGENIGMDEEHPDIWMASFTIWFEIVSKNTDGHG